VRPIGQPRDEAHDKTNHGANETHYDTVGPHDQPDVPVGRSERAEHADRTQSSLGEYRESRHGHQPNQHHREVASASVMVSGFMTFACAADDGVSTFRPMEDGLRPGALNNTVTATST